MPSIVLSPNFVLTEAAGYGLTEDHPIVGYQNVVVAANVSADTEDAYHPVTNLANPATFLSWLADDTTEQYVTIATGTADEIDYLALARHNLSTAGVAVSVGYFDASSPPVWTELTTPAILPDDGPLLFRFTPQVLSSISIKLASGSAAAQIAVAFVGKLLVLPRRLWQGIAPARDARVSTVMNGESEQGEFLGRIVTREFVETTVPLSLIDPDYHRTYIRDFITASKTDPFFFAWRPSTYPHEVAYCQMRKDPIATNQSPHGLISMTWELRGII